MAWAQSQKELDDLKRLAQQRKEEAEARKQLNDAESRIEIATDQNNVRADKLQLQRQAEHERSMAARQRFADSHAMTAVRDPGRFAPQAVKGRTGGSATGDTSSTRRSRRRVTRRARRRGA